MPTDGDAHSVRASGRPASRLAPGVANGGPTDGVREWPWALRSERPRLLTKDQLPSLLEDVREMEACVASLSRLRVKPKDRSSVKWARRARREREANRGAEFEDQRLRLQVLQRQRYLQRFGKLLRQVAIILCVYALCISCAPCWSIAL